MTTVDSSKEWLSNILRMLYFGKAFIEDLHPKQTEVVVYKNQDTFQKNNLLGIFVTTISLPLTVPPALCTILYFT